MELIKNDKTVLSGLLSFVFYSISDEIVAFNSVFSRIWQFLIGNMKQLIFHKILFLRNDCVPYHRQKTISDN